MVTVTGSGKIVLDRNDFEKHKNGESFQHNASTINLDSNINIKTTTSSNVQECLSNISTILNNSDVPDATATLKGLIKLFGDLSGTADSVVVTGLRGVSVSSLAPTNGQVLSYNSTSNSWQPSNPTNFVAGNDLSGSSSSQNVIKLTGNAGVVNVSASTFLFSNTATPTFSQAGSISGNGRTTKIISQNALSFPGSPNKSGGDLILSSGASVGTGVPGSIILKTANEDHWFIEAADIRNTGQRVLSLFKQSKLTTTEMPVNSGSDVIYIRNTSTPPTTGSPVGGTVLYSHDDQIRIKQPNGLDFFIGQILSSQTSGALSTSVPQLNIDRVATSSNASTRTNAMTIALEDETHMHVKITALGKRANSNEVAQYKIDSGYVRTGGGAPSIIGSIAYTDTRTNGAASGWTTPDITISGNNIIVRTGYSSSNSVRWAFIIETYKHKTS